MIYTLTLELINDINAIIIALIHKIISNFMLIFKNLKNDCYK